MANRRPEPIAYESKESKLSKIYERIFNIISGLAKTLY